MYRKRNPLGSVGRKKGSYRLSSEVAMNRSSLHWRLVPILWYPAWLDHPPQYYSINEDAWPASVVLKLTFWLGLLILELRWSSGSNDRTLDSKSISTQDGHRGISLLAPEFRVWASRQQIMLKRARCQMVQAVLSDCIPDTVTNSLGRLANL